MELTLKHLLCLLVVWVWSLWRNMNSMADITDSETAELIRAVNERKHVFSDLEKQKDELQQVV